MKKGKYVIVRSVNAGVFAGELKKKTGDEVTLKNVRRLWYWKGAASLSQLAMKGVSRPGECKFPAEMKKVVILKVCEIISVTKVARKSISEVPEWTA